MTLKERKQKQVKAILRPQHHSQSPFICYVSPHLHRSLRMDTQVWCTQEIHGGLQTQFKCARAPLHTPSSQWVNCTDTNVYSPVPRVKIRLVSPLNKQLFSNHVWSLHHAGCRFIMPWSISHGHFKASPSRNWVTWHSWSFWDHYQLCNNPSSEHIFASLLFLSDTYNTQNISGSTLCKVKSKVTLNEPHDLDNIKGLLLSTVQNLQL